MKNLKMLNKEVDIISNEIMKEPVSVERFAENFRKYEQNKEEMHFLREIKHFIMLIAVDLSIEIDKEFLNEEFFRCIYKLLKEKTVIAFKKGYILAGTLPHYLTLFTEQEKEENFVQ